MSRAQHGRGFARAFACVCGWLAACSNVGHPLVDIGHPQGETLPVLSCPPSPTCELEEHPSRVVFQPAALLASAVEECASLPPCRDPFGQKDADETDPMLDEDDAGVGEPSVLLAAPSCATRMQVEGLAPSALAELSCERVLVEGGVGKSSRLEISDVHWEFVELMFSASEPLEIALKGAHLESASVRLRGPVTLRLSHNSSLVDVSIAGESTEAGSPTFELEHGTARGLTLGTTEAAFEGRARVLRTTLEGTQLVADSVELESITLADGFVRTQSLHAADAELMRTRLAFEDAVLSGSKLTESEVTGCGSLSLLTVEAIVSHFAACERTMRVYGSKMLSAVANGPIESDSTSWQYPTIGLHAQTELVMWGSQMYAARFCEQAHSFEVESSSVLCSACDQGVLEEPDAVCVIPPMGSTISSNVCLPLLEPKECIEPLPERMRPLRIAL